MYSLPGKIVFSTHFCRHSSAFDRATVSLECQMGRRNALLHFDVFHCRNKHTRWAGERTKIRFLRPKNEYNFFRGGSAPSPDPTPNGEGVFNGATPTILAPALGARLGSWIRPYSKINNTLCLVKTPASIMMCNSNWLLTDIVLCTYK